MNRNTDSIPYGKPCLGPEEEKAVIRVLRSGWITTAKEARLFETEFASVVGTKHALAVNSCTAALHLGLEAMGVGPGDSVITSPYTFTASAEVLFYLGATPVFVDVEKNAYNIDPERVEKTIRSMKIKPKVILPIHIGGQLCDMDALTDIAGRYGCKILEDAAHAFPVPGAGTTGDAGAFSFYANKSITTGEGGMLVTNNPEIANRASVMRLHGIDREIWDRYNNSRKHRFWEYQVVEAGYKYNMGDIAAAIGREQLKKAQSFRDRRAEIAKRYNAAFRNNPCFELPPADATHSWHLYLLRINPQVCSRSRDDCIEALQDQGIGTSVHFIPLHIMPFYRRRFGFKPDDFPRALDSFQRSISLPIYPDLDDPQVDRIIQAVENISDKK